MIIEPVVGVLGGTFDPVHLGHLAMARAARRSLGLRRVLLLPTAIPPHKSVPDLTGPVHREAMLRLALDGESGLEISTLELQTGSVCYTIDSLRRLRQGPPPCSPVFVLGMDSLLEIDTWRDHEDLLREFDLAVIDRDGDGIEQARGLLPASLLDRVIEVGEDPGPAAARLTPGGGGTVFHLSMEAVPVSSTQIRRRAAAGESLDGLVPPAVARYIRVNGLYRQEDRH